MSFFNGLAGLPIKARVNDVNVQVFGSRHDDQSVLEYRIWNKPKGDFRLVNIWAVGAGGGGGSGTKGAASTSRTGGGGGGGGAINEVTLEYDQCPPRFFVLVGQGGAGGTSQTLDSAGGVNGSGGTTTVLYLPPLDFGNIFMFVNGGGGGAQGTTVITAGGAAGTGDISGIIGGAGDHVGVNGSFQANDAMSSRAAGGGGGGGGITTGNVAGQGGFGCRSLSFAVNSVFLGTVGVGGAPGGSGVPPVLTLPALNRGGLGGNGGGGSTTGNGGTGSRGGFYGGGGGGGGCCTNALGDSGAGGQGGRGHCVITCY